MPTIIVIVVIWLVIGSLIKAAKNAGSNQQNRPGVPNPPQGARPVRPIPPLTPAARPSAGTPDWSEIMTMLSGEPTRPAQPQELSPEGAPAEPSVPSGSLTGPSIMEGPGMMEGSKPMMDESAPDYEGATLPGELSADAVAVLPKTDLPASPPLQGVFRPKRYDPSAMRDAVVWAEILSRPRALRRRGSL